MRRIPNKRQLPFDKRRCRIARGWTPQLDVFRHATHLSKVLTESLECVKELLYTPCIMPRRIMAPIFRGLRRVDPSYVGNCPLR
jgi:hypothetical protein